MLSQFAGWPGAMISPQWLELPMSRIHFHRPKEVRAIKVLLNFLYSIPKAEHLSNNSMNIWNSFAKHKRYGTLHPHEEFIHKIDR